MSAWKHGAMLCPDGTSTRFRVWAPLAKQVKLILVNQENKAHTMARQESGYFELTVAGCPPGTKYLYQLDDDPPRPDPASRWQPDGVHGPSAVANVEHNWTDSEWFGISLEEMVLYELHVGTFTSEGTFDGAIAELPRLKELGITAVELMPIAQFPGSRNWGYDGAYMYAAQNSYGALEGLQRFVDAAHRLKLAVVLDVVYNHLGPEGNYLSCFGPYFTDLYRTPWGSSLNFDSAYSNGVRDFFLGNAIYWIEYCHVDALRLDAVHAIIDTSAYPFLQQLADECHHLGRQLHRRVQVIGENDHNDPKFTMPAELGGIGADSQWSDDFHHALHSVLTGENHAYYSDFGKVSQLAKAYTDGFVFDGCYSPGRKRNYGADGRDLEGIRFVACSQNHDQVGNRPMGERLSMLLNFSQLKLAAAALLCSPYIPLIFMGEESAAKSPFLYFVSHSDPELIKAVREGRANEFRELFAFGEAVDPQLEDTFQRSKLQPNTSAEGSAITRLYKELLRLRKAIPALQPLNKRQTFTEANDKRRTLVLKRGYSDSEAICFFNFSGSEQRIVVAAGEGEWDIVLDTESKEFEGKREYPLTSLMSDGELDLRVHEYSAVVLEHRRTPQVHNASTSSNNTGQ